MERHIAVLLGTAREGRESEKVATFVMNELKNADETATLYDVRGQVPTATAPIWQDGVTPSAWAELARRSDAFIVVSPEYNHSYPGELKMTIDSAFTKEYGRKPVAFVTVSSGSFAGVRVFLKLVDLSMEVGLVPMSVALHIGKVKEAFDSRGIPTDEKMRDRFAKLLAELNDFRQALSTIRDK